MPPRRRADLAATSLLLLLVSTSAVAAEALTYGADVGVGETDNVSLVSTDKRSQTLAIADLDFDVMQRSRVFDIDAKGDFSELDYLQGAYASELVGRLDGIARYALIPEKISWTLQEDFGQSQLDPFMPVTPSNRENINYASTGPNFDLRVGSLGFLDASLRYARTDYETSPFDNVRYLGTLALGESISARSSVSINMTSQRVLFDNTTLNTDFDRSSLFAQYDLGGARTELKASLGGTRVDVGAGAEPQAISGIPTGQIAGAGSPAQSETGPLAKLELTRVLSPSSKLTLVAGQDITDASAGFSALQAGAAGAIGTAPATTTSSNYAITYASASWLYGRDRTNLAVTGQWEADRYAGLSVLDVERGSLQINVNRQITRELSAQLIGSVYRTSYLHSEFDATEGIVGGALVLREGRWLELKLRYEHASQVASGYGAQNFAENRAFLTVGYRPRPGSMDVSPLPSGISGGQGSPPGSSRSITP